MADEIMADGESHLLIDDIVYADPKKYHPHVVLIYKCYTAKEVADNPYPEALYEVACIQEELKIPPPRVPWPLLASSLREEIELGVEEWRVSTLRIMDERMALFDSSEKTSRPATCSAVSDSGHGFPHRALGVKELLEHMLREAALCTLYAAWNVSKGWRDMVSYILQTRFHSPYPCDPVDRGRAISPKIRLDAAIRR